jgi:hypothetical protein
MKHKGTIYQGNKIISEGMEIIISTHGSAIGLMSWNGRFTLPNNISIDVGKYSIKTEDGKSGHIVIKNVHISNMGTKIVDFIGTGSFK